MPVKALADFHRTKNGKRYMTCHGGNGDTIKEARKNFLADPTVDEKYKRDFFLEKSKIFYGYQVWVIDDRK